ALRLPRPLIRSSILTAVTAALLFLTAAGSSAGAAPTPPCYRYRLAVRPKWICSAVWVPSLRKILVSDSATNKLLLYSPRGEAGPLPDPRLAAAATLPTLLATSGKGFFLLLVSGEILVLDDHLNLTGRHHAWSAGPSRRGQVNWLAQLATTGESIVGYGSLHSFSLSSLKGFLRMPLAGGRAKMLLPYSQDSYYTLGHPYLTSIGPSAYALLIGDRQAALMRFTPGHPPVRMRAFPPSRQVPRITNPMTGLYSTSGNLYILTRRPGPRATLWELWKIDPQRDRLLGHSTLPTTAHHLTVVPSEQEWLLFEKDGIDIIGQQTIPTLLTVSYRALESTLASGDLGTTPQPSLTCRNEGSTLP
nr:hypothetical protein [Acidobacteriota bacterium]